jgi:NADPH:quinone reductase-like Zn-dependent oxidoreductase
MLFTSGAAAPGDRVLVQGAGGGVSTAAVLLGAAAGLEVHVTSRDEGKRARAVALGAASALEPGGRLPARADVVLETVGAATWGHSVRSVRPGGTIVVAGATSGDASPAELTRIFFGEIRVLGVTMGSRDDLLALLNLLVRTGIRPPVDRELPLTRARDALAHLQSGAQFGKVVLTTA